MDDLDKIGDASPLGQRDDGNVPQNTHSEENLSSGKSSDKNKVMSKDSNDNLSEETPPPLFPRKRTTKLDPRTDEAYDTLIIPPNLAQRLRPSPSTREYPPDTVQVTPSPLPGHTKTRKHRYANLDAEVPTQPEQTPVHHSSDAFEEDPYDDLVLPTRNYASIKNREGGNNEPFPRDTAFTNTNIVELNSSNMVDVGLELQQQESNNIYDTVTLRNTPYTNGNSSGNAARLRSQGNVYETLIVRDFSPGKQDLNQVGITSDAYEYHTPKNIPNTSTLQTIPSNVAIVASNTKESPDALIVPPALPPKSYKRDDDTVTSKQQSTTMPSIRSSSPHLTRPVQKYSPPVAPRKKPPRTLPKPRKVIE